MSTHNICFRGEIRKIFTGYPPLSRPMYGVCFITFSSFDASRRLFFVIMAFSGYLHLLFCSNLRTSRVRK